MTPTPVPAASERMTAERLAEIRRKLPASFDQELAHETDKVLTYVDNLLALVDKQAADLAKMTDGWRTAFDIGIANQERCQSLERELAEAKQHIAEGIVSLCVCADGYKTPRMGCDCVTCTVKRADARAATLTARAEAAEARAETAHYWLEQINATATEPRANIGPAATRKELEDALKAIRKMSERALTAPPPTAKEG